MNHLLFSGYTHYNSSTLLKCKIILSKVKRNSYIFYMRPIVHPAKEDVTLEAFFYALSNATRLKIITNLYKAHKDGEEHLNCALSVTGIEKLPASTTSHHFRIMREGGLVHSERVGKDCNNSLRIKDMDERFNGLYSKILENLKDHY